jgi:nitrogen regulatory protein PII
MYLLTAIFNQNCLEDVLTDLSENDIEGVTITNVSGKGGLSLISKLDQNVKLEIVLSSESFKETAKECIRSNTREITIGSGKMWVTPVLEVERIRTGETGESALSHTHAANKHTIAENYYTPVDTPAS